MQLIILAKKMKKKYQDNVEKTKIRLIEPGVGAKPKLLVEDQILLTLIYLRQGLTFQMLGLHREQIYNNYFSYWPKIFRDILPSSLLEQVKWNGENEEILTNFLKEYELIVDSASYSKA